ncbi:MAG: hypothetical protein FWE62_05350 [Firmicutes bacterium]|nr:hypothetical protein [Bacillota bacterium]
MEQAYRNYEYMTLTADRQDANETANRYASLGWELDGQENGVFQTALTFKRERNITNKDRLNRLQLRIEDCADGIDRLERSKTQKASMMLTISGVLFALIFGGGMSLAILNPPAASLVFIGGIVLGVIGLGLGALIYPFYRGFIKKNTAKIDPLIEKKKDDLADLCQEAHNLLLTA